MTQFQICLMALISMSAAAVAQNAPVDFEPEGHGADWSWNTFENVSNPDLETIPNPYPTGINSSAHVAQFIAYADGAPFAGCETMHGADIGSFTIDENNMIIRIMVWKSVISNVGIKLVREDNWSLGELLVSNTVVDQWEQLTFDFSSHIGNTYDQIVIFPDFADREEDHIVYFDNIMGLEATVGIANEESELELKIYPSPAQETLSVASSSAIDEIHVFSLTGTLVQSVFPKNNGLVTLLDIGTLSNGLYLIEVRSVGTRPKSTRFVKG